MLCYGQVFAEAANVGRQFGIEFIPVADFRMVTPSLSRRWLPLYHSTFIGLSVKEKVHGLPSIKWASNLQITMESIMRREEPSGPENEIVLVYQYSIGTLFL